MSLFPGWGRYLEEEVATHSSILAWRIPWTEPGGVQSIGLQRVGRDQAQTSAHVRVHTHTHTRTHTHRTCCIPGDIAKGIETIIQL